MKVSVRAFADLRNLLPPEDSVWLPDGENIRGLLRMLAERRVAFLAKVLDESGQLRSSVNILCNGKNIQYLNGLDTGLADEDVIAIFPPIAGG